MIAIIAFIAYSECSNCLVGINSFLHTIPDTETKRSCCKIWLSNIQMDESGHEGLFGCPFADV